MARIKHKKKHTSRPLPPHSPPISVCSEDDEDEDEEVANYQEQLQSSGFLMNARSDPVYREVIDDCELALSLLSRRRRGQWAKADRFIKQLRGNHDSFAIFHRVRAQIHSVCADNAADQEAKKQRIENAISSARRATVLSPSNIEYSLFYVKLLIYYRDNEFEVAVTECKRALAVPYPISFLVERSGKWDGTAKAKIVSYKEKLRSILDTIETVYHIEVGVQDFEEHCFLLGKKDFVSEALKFAKENQTWRFWACPGCADKFGDSELHLEHVVKEHVGIFSEELKLLFPKEVNQDRMKALYNGMFCNSNDEKRYKFLKEIGARILMLVEYEYLTDSHLDYMEVQAPELCLEVLDFSRLQKVIRFLQSMAMACKLLSRQSENISFDHEIPQVPESEVVVEKIFLDHESAKLIMDPPTFPSDSTSRFLRSWLDEGPSWDESFLAWTERRMLRESQGEIILMMLKNEFTDLNALCTNKRDLIIHWEALKLLNELCEKELAEKHQRRDDNDIMKVISEIRKEEETIQRMEESLALEICRVDARMRHSLSKTRRLKLKLTVNSGADYHSVLVPLLKSYIEDGATDGEQENE